ncbi:MAG TPA: glycosyltransferase family 39 protein [Solirubrobacteraceae bacterium]|nr:glycosyltransferase family 39 protein [Solirubrobacteraceae bacterium]
MSYSWETQSAASPSTPAPLHGASNLGEALRARARALAARVRHPELLGVMALAAVLNLWSLSKNGWANEFYAAAVKSMSGSWHDFLFASLDKAGVMTVDKPPLALWVQALSVRVFGFHPLSILVPQALMGVASVALVYDLVRRRFGRVGGFVAGLALALTPITVAISRHNNPDALLVLCCVAALWCFVRALESAAAGRGTRWLVAAGVCVGLAFETKMLVALVVVPGMALAWLWLAPRAVAADATIATGGAGAAEGAIAADGADAADADATIAADDAVRAVSGARARVHALGQLLWGGLALLVVGGAWPLLVELTPASQRPWISGTSDNTVLSLIFEYNGLGRVDGQAGGPGGAGAGGGANTLFGGSTGPLRLLNSALGGQAGWLLGFALVSGLSILLACRLRRGDARSGWLVAVGGAFATTAVLFSFASGIFHPYYVSLLAPFAAALVGAGAAQLIGGGVNARIVGPLAVLAGVVVELVVRGDYPGQLTWLAPVLIVVGALAALALLAFSSRAVRAAAVCAALAALLAAPAVWAFDTLGHKTAGTFPEGGPASLVSGGPGGPGGGFARLGASRVGAPGAGAAPGAGGAPGAGAAPGAGGAPGVAAAPAAGAGAGAAGGAAGAGPAGAEGGFAPSAGAAAGTAAGGEARAGVQLFGGSASSSAARGGGLGFGSRGGGGAMGAPIGGSVSASVESYVRQHGGGTIAVSSQSNAASAILRGYDVVGIGGFSGRESDVSVSWLAQEVRAGQIRWVLDDEGAGGAAATGGGFGAFAAPAGGAGGVAPGGAGAGETGLFSGAGSTGAGSAGVGSTGANGFGGASHAGAQRGRTGSRTAMAAVAKACRKVTLSSGAASGAGEAAASGAASSTGATGGGTAGTLYDCAGRASALARLSTQQSRS